MRTDLSEIKSDDAAKVEKLILYGLLLREEFRQMLLHTEYGRDYFLDDNTYVDIPESVGCFRTGARWTVYETDERGKHVLKQRFDNPFLAYLDAASRRKLSFTPSEVAQSVLRDTLSREQLSKQLRAVRLAIQNLKKVDQLMCLTENPDAVKEDIRILEYTSARLQDRLLRSVVYQDRYLVCKVCGNEFVFTASEQEFYAERGFQNEPQLCKVCRDARKNAVRRGPRKYFTAVCTGCGREQKLPFEPKSDRPVYCSECYNYYQVAILG